MERTYSLQELIAAFKRRRLVFALVALGIFAIACAYVLWLPSEYRAESMVQIEPHRLAPDYFPAAPMTSFEDRMRTLKHGLLARPVLERVVREVDLYPDLGDDMDRKLERLRANTEVRLEGEIVAGPPSLMFVVDVRGEDREKVARAAQLLPTYYGEMTRDVLSKQSRALQQTLESQMAEMDKELGADEKRIAAFKAQHSTELPEVDEANMRAASRIEAQIGARLAAIDDAQRRRTLVLTMIPERDSEAGHALTGAADLSHRLDAARADYRADHPELRRLEREYNEASGRRDAELQQFASDRVAAHVKLIDSEIRDHRSALRDLQRQLDVYQGRLDASPRWGEELRSMSRPYEALKAKYATTLARAADARAAEQLLEAEAGGLFRFVQPAVAPAHPSGPAREKLILIALLGALAAGLVAAGVTEYLDSSLRGPEDAGAFGVPVLAAIPRIGPRRSA